VRYDPAKVSYRRLLEVFWRNVDPFAKDRQFCDRGNQYRSAIFVHDDQQRREAEASKAEIEASPALRAFGPIVTEIAGASRFYPAEAYHQDYYREHPLRYKLYRSGCGRDARLREIWGGGAGGH
jgi:peptide-methionine (S)-S-oxide reductase